MVELVDTLVSEASGGNPVEVQVLLLAPQSDQRSCKTLTTSRPGRTESEFAPDSIKRPGLGAFNALE